jgi:UDP-N-acetylglucosamine 2-epimerase (non-hydrolysing)
MILLAYGTRPEYIKLKPIIDELRKNNFEFNILFTGQQVHIGEFEYDWILNIENKPNRLDSIVSSITGQLWEFFRSFCKLNTETGKFVDAYVMVQGDTTSAFAVALSAFHHGIKVIHLEAGLRTYDKENPYPEEVNRRIISQIADIHLCPTDWAARNLAGEKILDDVYVVGNTVIDNLLLYKDKCIYTNKILVTLHRRENHHWMDRWFTELEKLATEYPQYAFILPMHPNPNVQKWKHLLKNVVVIDPLPYEDMLELLVQCRMVITDSGGLQEESCFFNKICLTCRIVTERPEAIGVNGLLVTRPEDLKYFFDEVHNDYEINVECPFGDGHAAEKIIEILKRLQ